MQKGALVGSLGRPDWGIAFAPMHAWFSKLQGLSAQQCVRWQLRDVRTMLEFHRSSLIFLSMVQQVRWHSSCLWSSRWRGSLGPVLAKGSRALAEVGLGQEDRSRTYFCCHGEPSTDFYSTKPKS